MERSMTLGEAIQKLKDLSITVDVDVLLSVLDDGSISFYAYACRNSRHY